jgi:hypothetical protein
MPTFLGHDHMKEKAEDYDQHDQKQDELGKGADVPSCPSFLKEKNNLRWEEFHDRCG